MSKNVLNINEELLEALEDAVSVLKYYQSEGVKVCKCQDDYECRFCKAERVASNVRKMVVRRGGKVRCKTTGKEFPNAVKAGEFYKVSPSSIGKCCKGTAKYTTSPIGIKLTWEYA